MKRLNLILLISILVLVVAVSLSFVFIFNEPKENINESLNNQENITQEIGGEVNQEVPEEVQEEVELSFREKTLEYDTSEKVMNLVNSFMLIERDNVLLPANEVYEAEEGTEYDLFRMALNILLDHNIQGAILVYDYSGEIGAVVNFRDVEKPMYYYFEEGVMKMAHHGWSFDELIEAEESRLGINIDKYGILFEGDVRDDIEMNIMDVEEWVDAE